MFVSVTSTSSFAPVLSADGKLAAFVTTQWDPASFDMVHGLYLYDRPAGALTLVNRAPGSVAALRHLVDLAGPARRERLCVMMSTSLRASLSQVLLPHLSGKGVVAVREILAGVPNVVSKMLGSGSKINNVKATFDALRKLKAPPAKISADKADKTDAK